MADTMYRRPVTLNDILLGANAGTAPPVAPAQPSPSSMDEGLLSTDQRSQLLEALMRPTDLGPEPTVDKRNVGAEIFSALGDALGTYSASYLGGQKPEYLGRYFGKREHQRQERDQFRKQAALVKSEEDRRKASFLLGRDESATARRDRIAADKVLQDASIQQKKEELAVREAMTAEASRQAQLDRESRERIEAAGNATRIKVENLQNELHRIQKTELADRDQLAEYAAGKQAIVAKKREYAQGLKDGTITPEQITEEWQDIRAASMLSGKYLEAIDAFWNDQIGMLIMRNAPPMGPDPNPGPGAMGYIGSQLLDKVKQVVGDVTKPIAGGRK